MNDITMAIVAGIFGVLFMCMLLFFIWNKHNEADEDLEFHDEHEFLCDADYHRKL